MLDNRQNRNNQIVGKRLLEARKLSGLTARAAANIAGVSAQSISLYEQGKCVPSADVFEKLVLFYEMPWEFYFKPVNQVSIEGPIFYRKFSRATKVSREIERVKAKFFAEDIVRELSMYIRFPQVDKLFMEIKQSMNIEKKGFDANLMAKLIRRYWGLSDAPIDNLCYELEKRGVFVVKLDLNDDIDGFSFWADGRPYMFVNQNNNYFRLRMSLAHELCHLFFHGAEDVEKDLDRVETEAKNFAGAFLLPDPGFTKSVAVTSLQGLLRLKLMWKVSLQGILMRCKQLKLIDDARYLYLNKQISVKRWRKTEPYDRDFEPEAPILCKQAATLLVEKNVLSKSVLREKIALKKDFIEQACSLPEGFFTEKPATVIQLFKQPQA